MHGVEANGSAAVRRVWARRVVPTNGPTHVTHKRLMARSMDRGTPACLGVRVRWGTTMDDVVLVRCHTRVHVPDAKKQFSLA
jgi:hypothetical protein